MQKSTLIHFLLAQSLNFKNRSKVFHLTHSCFFSPLKKKPFLLVSASVASAKKILVHGPDLSSIPSQLFIHEVSPSQSYPFVLCVLCIDLLFWNKNIL